VVRAMPFQKITATKVEDLITFNGVVSYDDLVEVVLEHGESIYLTASWENFPSIWPLILFEELVSDTVKTWLKHVQGPQDELPIPHFGFNESIREGLVFEGLEIGQKPTLLVKSERGQQFRYTYHSPIIEFKPTSRRDLKTP
jgi:hypothetical protein